MMHPLNSACTAVNREVPEWSEEKGFGHMQGDKITQLLGIMVEEIRELRSEQARFRKVVVVLTRDYRP
jgi:hypothetical protein